MFHEDNNIKINGGVLVVYTLLEQKFTFKFYQKSGVKRWCKMSGGVIELFK